MRKLKHEFDMIVMDSLIDESNKKIAAVEELEKAVKKKDKTFLVSSAKARLTIKINKKKLRLTFFSIKRGSKEAQQTKTRAIILS